ncbi:MAG: hypothetical protein ACLQFW_04690 [Xanthobacteraceae bacterium]
MVDSAHLRGMEEALQRMAKNASSAGPSNNAGAKSSKDRGRLLTPSEQEDMVDKHQLQAMEEAFEEMKRAKNPLIGQPAQGIAPHRVATADGTTIDTTPIVVEAGSLKTSQDAGYDASTTNRKFPTAAALVMARAFRRAGVARGDLGLVRAANSLHKEALAALKKRQSALSNSEASNELPSPKRKSANRGIGDTVSDSDLFALPESGRMPRYKVMVHDNFHYQEDDRWEQGVYESVERAIAACRGIVDKSLEEGYKPGISAKKLYDHYVSFGDDPFIVVLDGADERAEFSAWSYAKERCRGICQERSPMPQAAAKEPTSTSDLPASSTAAKPVSLPLSDFERDDRDTEKMVATLRRVAERRRLLKQAGNPSSASQSPASRPTE